jgi:hypothetical protein
MDMAFRQQCANSAAGERSAIRTGSEKAKEDFLKEVAKHKEFWKTLANCVLERLEGLRSLDPAVDTTIMHRVKSEESLRGKIEKLQGLNKCLDLEPMHRMQWDIVGIRIYLYFPRQLEQLKSFIEDHLEVIWQPSRYQELNQAVADGPIVGSVPAGSISAKHFRERDYQMKDPESRPYKERMGYYEADHYWIKLRESIAKSRRRFLATTTMRWRSKCAQC